MGESFVGILGVKKLYEEETKDKLETNVKK